MSMFYARYAIGLFCGVIFGLVFSAFVSWWLCFGVLLALAAIIITKFICELRFGWRWHDYRMRIYGYYIAITVCILVGMLLSGEKIGELLINIGRLIS